MGEICTKFPNEVFPDVHFRVDFYFLIFYFPILFYGGALTCTSRSLSPSISTLSVMGVCWTRCPCPTFVRRIAVSHASYLPNTVVTHLVSLHPIDHIRVSSPLSTFYILHFLFFIIFYFPPALSLALSAALVFEQQSLRRY